MIKFAHNNFNVLDLEKSLQFYQEALNLKESAGQKSRTSHWYI